MSEITGTIMQINPTEVKSEKFKARTLVLQTSEKYPQSLLIQFSQDKCGLLDRFSEGQTVKIAYNLRGREYNGRYYTTIEGWKIENS